MGKGNDSIGCLGVFAILIAIPIVLIMNHPVLFFLVIFPVSVVLIVVFIKWLKK